MTPKILVVDDDDETRRVLRCVLAPVAEVLEAAGGAEALRLITAEKPQLVLLDVVMPVMGGLDVLESGLKLAPSLIVVMLSGQSDIAIAKDALDKGSRAYITKPIDPRLLREVIEDLLGLGEREGDAAQKKPWRVVG
ncbi:MAG: response regulator [Elusimicrobia bacterium]|nr:response regulator [Elusimicrobiota bacterium]